jgi:hypothetical protein
MATVDSSSIASALQKRFEDDVVQNIQRAAPMLQILGPNVRDAEGQNIQWVNKFGDASAGSAAAITEGADVSTFNTDEKVTAVLTYGTYHDAFELTGKAISIALASGNPRVLADLFGSEITDSAQRLARALAGEFYNGNGSGERMVGLLGGAITSSGTYAGISRSTYPQWRGNVRANGGVGRSPSFALMRQISTDVYKASGVRPNMIVCGPATHDAYGALFGEMRRYVDTIQGPGGAVTLRGGYRALEMDGIPVVEDVNCPEGKMLFLNMDKMFFKQLPQPGQAIATSNATQRPLETAAEQTRGGGRINLRVRVQPLSVNGDKFRFALYIYPQVQVRQPNAFGILDDLTYPS